MADAWEQPRRRRPWAPVVVALAAALVAGAVVATGAGPAAETGSLPVEEQPSAPTEPAAPDGPPEQGAAPDAPPEQGVAPDAPPEGDAPGAGRQARPGEPATAATAPGEGWRSLPPAPLDARLEPLSVWTGEEFVVWGGTVDGELAADGAAYDPGRDRWRRLADAPAGMSASTHAATWTGQQVVAWGAGRHGGGVAYDPDEDRWRVLPEAPVATDGGRRTVAWTGREVLVWSGEGAAYDPVADRWRPLPAAPALSDRSIAVWVDGPDCAGCGRLLVWAYPGIGGWWWPGAAYDAATDRWEQIRAARLPLGGAGLTATWTGETAVLCCAPSSDTALAVYDPAHDRWRDPVDGPVAGRTLHTAEWTGDELLVWGGRQDRDRWLRGNGATWNPGTGRWRGLPEAAPRMPRQLHASAWTGEELLVWGGYDGRTARGDGAALDPVPAGGAGGGH